MTGSLQPPCTRDSRSPPPLPKPAYTVYAWIREEAQEFVGVVLASAAAPYAGRESYERRWETEGAAVDGVDWMARALAAKIEKRGVELIEVKHLTEPPREISG